MVKVYLKDGKELLVKEGISYSDLASQLSVSLRKKTAGVKANGNFVDLSMVVKGESTVEFVIWDDEKGVFPLINHSTAHLMAQAMLRLFPGIHFAIGPAIEEGYYYDFLAPRPIVAEDFPAIESEMLKIVKENLPIIRKEISKSEALIAFKENPFKVEMIQELEGTISTYTQGEFTDLCVGPHVERTGLLKHFKLLSVAGAYWRGDSNRQQLQRIYGTSHTTAESLQAYLQLLEERKERDHRKLGKALDIFMFSPLVGQGLPLWLPNGMRVRKVLQDYITRLEEKFGYDHVYTPVLGAVDLYRASGHWDHYQENMFPMMKVDNEELVLRPMACPHHAQVFKSQLRSYRDLPVRLAEQVVQYRYEASGSLTGLERVRAMVLTDSHVFCRPDQIKQEFSHGLKLILRVLSDLNIDISYYRLSLRDKKNKEKYFDSDEMWDKAENKLREALRENKIDFIEAEGEAAFYGPKLDIQIKTVIGHDITLSTLQLDFLLPERLDLNYIGEDGQKKRPVMIHRGLIGTYERFMAVLLEQYKGVFPTWLAPIQINLLPVAPEIHGAYAQELLEQMIDIGLRAKADAREEKLGYRLRESQINKIPYTLVLGDQEIANRSVTYRRYGEKDQITVSLEEFLKIIQKDIQGKGKV